MTTKAVQLPLLMTLRELDNLVPNDAFLHDYDSYTPEESYRILWEDKEDECSPGFLRSIAKEGVITPIKVQDLSTVPAGSGPLLYNGHHRIVAARARLKPDALIPVLFEDPNDEDLAVVGTSSYPAY